MPDAPEPNPEDVENFQQTQEREHTRPVPMFRGDPLQPYTRGTRTIYWQVTKGDDTVAFHDLAFIYIHTRTRQELVRVAWDQEKFRLALLEFADDLTDAEEREANRIRLEILDAERKSDVEAVPSQKKRGRRRVRSRATRRSSSTPSARS